ncbi:MAG: hypothetical protein ACUVRZ_03855 [Desulfobacca sp.]|uniref:hypothetical protein n=1 Tax=Desulfobacca sp. TaxID=2067990 RepID=UPI004049413B
MGQGVLPTRHRDRTGPGPGGRADEAPDDRGRLEEDFLAEEPVHTFSNKVGNAPQEVICAAAPSSNDR